MTSDANRELLADLLRVPTPDDSEYQLASRAEAEFWGTPQPFGVEALAEERGPIQEYTNERFTGDRDEEWYETIASYGSFQRGLFLGTSGLKQDARILKDLPELCAAFLDISEESLSRWERELGPRFPGRITTQAADLNFVELPRDTYDLVVSSSTFHHISNLEYLAAQINRALKPDGYFFLQDYAGEARYQFSEEKKRLFEKICDRSTARQPWRKPGTIWTNRDTSQFSPFCGVRSDDTLSVLATHLLEERLATAGAMVGLMLFSRPQDPGWAVAARRSLTKRAMASVRQRLAGMARAGGQVFLTPEYLHELLLVDALVCDSKLLLPHNAFAIYRKR